MVQLILTSYKSAKKAVLVGNHVHPYACLSINSNNMYIRKIFFLTYDIPYARPPDFLSVNRSSAQRKIQILYRFINL